MDYLFQFFLNKVIGFQSQNLQFFLYEKALQVINFKKFKFRVFIIPIKKVKKINFFFEILNKIIIFYIYNFEINLLIL